MSKYRKFTQEQCCLVRRRYCSDSGRLATAMSSPCL